MVKRTVADLKPYDAAGHFKMVAMRIHGKEETGAQKFWIGVSEFEPGGGAVFHDRGNLNFSFITGADRYDVEAQHEIILRAVRSFGIPCERSGRNDLLADGKRRKAARPKRKKLGHVALLTGAPEEFHHPAIQKLKQGEPVSDRELRRALAAFKEGNTLGER